MLGHTEQENIKNTRGSTSKKIGPFPAGTTAGFSIFPSFFWDAS